jgi:hypothetical protein
MQAPPATPGIFDTLKGHIANAAQSAHAAVTGAVNQPPIVRTDGGAAKALAAPIDARGGGYTITGARLRRKSRRGKKMRKTRRRKSRR